MRAPTLLGVLALTLLGLSAGCSFPDPIFVDGGGGAGSSAGNSATAGTAGSSGGGAAGGTCTDGCEPQLVAEGQGEVIAIAANETSVYWISTLEAENSAELRSAPVAGGDVEFVTGEDLSRSAGVLAVDDSRAFVANQSSGGMLLGIVLSDTTERWGFMQERIDTIIGKASNIYYSAPYGVVLLPKDGPNTGGRLDLTEVGGPRLLMLDGDDLLVLDQSDMREPPRHVVRLRADGSQAFADATVLLGDAPDFDSAAADAEAYYFADADQGEIVRLLRESPTAVEPLAQDEVSPRKLQLHSGVLYWTTSGRQLRSMTTSGEKPVTVDQAVPTVVTTSPAGVFWATPDGVIRRLER